MGRKAIKSAVSKRLFLKKCKALEIPLNPP
jgi:hypothetical protein